MESTATPLKPGWDVVIALMNKNSGSHIAPSNARSLASFSQEARSWNLATIYDEEEQATWRGPIEVRMETAPTKFSTSG